MIDQCRAAGAEVVEFRVQAKVSAANDGLDHRHGHLGARPVARMLFFVRRQPPIGEREWYDALAPAFRRRVADDPVAELFVKVAFRRRWLPDFITVPPHPADRSFADELRRVPAVRHETLLVDLATTLDGPVPEGLRGAEVAERVAALLDWVWLRGVRDEWPRRSRAFEADMVSRTRQLSTGGWAAALNGMRPDMRWLGDGRLQINLHDYPPQTIPDDELLFVPVTHPRGWVAWEQAANRYAIVYPCAGHLAGQPDRPPQALQRLLGPVRAGILVRLGAPMSTTQLVALTGGTLGSVGGHLKVLLDAGLVSRRRSGRSVLYYRTGAGDAVVRAAG
jgi:DNA-binding transcriptional ArsR family regulator